MAAAHIGDLCPGFQLRLHAVERRNPRAEKIGVIAGAEKPFGAAEQALVVFVPADAAAGLERRGDLVLIHPQRLHHLESAGEEGCG